MGSIFRSSDLRNERRGGAVTGLVSPQYRTSRKLVRVMNAMGKCTSAGWTGLLLDVSLE